MDIKEFKRRKAYLEDAISEVLTQFCKEYAVEPAAIDYTVLHVSTMDEIEVDLLRVSVSLKFEI